MSKNENMTIEDYGTVIYKVYSGSRSYGTNITEEMARKMATEKGGKWEDYVSDVDIRGIFIPHRHLLIGSEKVNEFRDPNDEDTVYFSLEKFVSLALECNPNVVEQLFVREEDILYMNDIGKELRDFRYEFLTKNAFGRFGSYAWSQLNRMTNRTEGFDRNVKRQRLIEAVGGDWDPKNAMHLIRLLKMLLEILNKGELHTFCTFRDLLLSIRNGEMRSDEVIQMADELFAESEVALKNSTIPNVPDFHKINEWVISAVDRTHGYEGSEGVFPGSSLKNLPIEYEMIDNCTMFLVSNPLVRKKNKSEAQGVVIPYKDWFIGLYDFKEFKFNKTTIEHIHKFISQVRGCNPRHIDTIFSSKENFLHKHPMSDEFIALMRMLPTAKRAYHTAKGFITGNLKKMDNWEHLKERHNALREEVLEAKKLPKRFWDEQLTILENEKQSLTLKYQTEYDELFDKLLLIDSDASKNHWKSDLSSLNQEYRNTMESLRSKKDKIIKKQQKWLELSNKKGNMPTFPPIPDKTPNENASAMGKFSYDTILASELYHVASMFIELIETGTIVNSRAYEDEMYSIKHGKYKKYEEFKSSMENLLDQLDEVFKSSPLGNHDFEKVQEKVIDFIDRYHKTL